MPGVMAAGEAIMTGALTTNPASRSSRSFRLIQPE